MSGPDAVAGRVRQAQRALRTRAAPLPARSSRWSPPRTTARRELVFSLEVGGPVAAVVWLPAGVGIAALYLGGNRLWPGVLIGDLLVNDYGALPLGTALPRRAGTWSRSSIAAMAAAPLRARRRPPLGSIGAS